MMSLPSISRLHDQREKDREDAHKAKMLRCEQCGKEFPSGAEGAFKEEYWSPLIPDEPSGMVFVCPECAEKLEEKYGDRYDRETYFECGDCGKLCIRNFSWELYAVETEDGEVCMACAAKRELHEDSPKWLTSEAAILAATESIEALQAYGPKHLSCIGGEKKYPFGVESFRDTEEYDAESYNFYNRLQFGYPDGHDPAADSRACLRAAFRFYGKVCLILAEAGQFQVYGEVVVDPASKRAEPLPHFEGEGDLKSRRYIPAGSSPDPVTRY